MDRFHDIESRNCYITNTLSYYLIKDVSNINYNCKWLLININLYIFYERNCESMLRLPKKRMMIVDWEMCMSRLFS